MMLYDYIANTNKESGERIAKLSTRQLEDGNPPTVFVSMEILKGV